MTLAVALTQIIIFVVSMFLAGLAMYAAFAIGDAIKERRANGEPVLNLKGFLKKTKDKKPIKQPKAAAASA